MVVWAGRSTSTSGYLADGGRYDPIANAWSPMSVGPEARVGHAAVSTGSQMLIWGSSDLQTNSGAIYDPLSDVWTSMTTSGAPNTHTFPTAVWTGTQMIVWGGYDFSGTVNSGGIYTPATDSWQSTSTSGAPTPRLDHSSVWTGSQMIIWGGRTQSPPTPLQTGGRYDPVTNTWTPTSTLGAPSPRGKHAAVWTGGHMVVWGGYSSYSAVIRSATGSAYDPVNNTWHPLSDEGGPPAIAPAAAVWTGTFMLVWGGSITGGGRYLIDHAPDLDSDGYPECAGDCDDSNSGVHPAAEEVCDGVDNDCDGTVDERDVDGDGVFGCGQDCDDSNASIHPGALEACNGVDEDCDGVADNGFPDQDSDGFKSCAGDCNDHNPAIHPGATELCNGVDDNCTAGVDEGFPNQDGDGYASCLDCNDTDASIHPGAVEVCNFLDDNCDAVIDEGFELDGDGISQCAGDCNDADPTAWDRPFEVVMVEAASVSPLTWTWFDEAPYTGPGVTYDVPSGTLGPAGGIDFQGGVCLGSPTVPQLTDDRPEPLPGSGYWYLFRARNSCEASTYGWSSSGFERVVASCP